MRRKQPYPQELEALHEVLTVNRLVPTDVWHSIGAEALGSQWGSQLFLLCCAAGACPEGVRVALELGASVSDPATRFFAVRANEVASFVRLPVAVFWWLLRPRARAGIRLGDDAEIQTPLQCGLSGRCPECLRLLFPGNPTTKDSDRFADAFAWLVQLRPNGHRLEAGLALLQAVEGLPAEEKYSQAIAEWLAAAEGWLNRQRPEDLAPEAPQMAGRLHRRMCRVFQRRGKVHAIPIGTLAVLLKTKPRAKTEPGQG